MRGRSWWKWLLALVVLVVLGLVAVGWMRRGAPAAAGAAAVQTATIVRGDVVQVVSCGGKLTSRRKVQIKCRASGQITGMPVNYGDAVKAGDLLLEVDPALETRQLRKAQIDLTSAEARRLQAKAQLETAECEMVTGAARARLDLASAQATAVDAAAKAQRMATLFARHLVSQEEDEAAQLASLQARNALGQAQSRVDDLPVQAQTVEERRQDLALAASAVETQQLLFEDAQLRMGDTHLHAPIDGVVVDPKVQVGQVITGSSDATGGTEVMSLVDLAQVFVLAEVDESQIGEVAVGQTAAIEMDALPDRPFTGVVRRIAPEGKSSQAGGVVTFEVMIEVTGKDLSLLRPEMTATLDIQTGEAKGALLVPIAAVQNRKGRTVVWMRGADGVKHEREVRLGLTDGEHQQVLSGLAEKDQVLVDSGSGDSKWRNDEN